MKHENNASIYICLNSSMRDVRDISLDSKSESLFSALEVQGCTLLNYTLHVLVELIEVHPVHVDSCVSLWDICVILSFIIQPVCDLLQ